ncbi:hypothetical protein C8K36_11057 [Rhodococcus sp. OK519]|uniref:hypothetical protein n=1 Tax=Rhodococcus sp. OK519 TaxID=2135729 RepID=UPI000D49DA3D|nr:hypothetical protein C8K36_11057 [Rhodococcus sp. OK519]
MEQTGNTSHNGRSSGNGRASFTDGAARTVSGIAQVTTSSIGALGGAAVGGVIGGVRGAVSGVTDGTRRGLERGSHSTPTAILTMAAAGAVGLVEWPVVLTVGGAALVLRQLHERGAPPARPPAAMKTTTVAESPKEHADGTAALNSATRKTATRKATTRKATKPAATSGAAKSGAAKSGAAKSAAARKSTTSRPRGRSTR